jgi:hypothetical protein
LTELAGMWPIGVLVVVLGSVILAFLHCAVAEAVMRFAAWVETPDREERAVRVEAWRRVLEDAAPRERPAHAASFLWVAVRHLPARRRFRPEPEPLSDGEHLTLEAYNGRMVLTVVREDGSADAFAFGSLEEAEAAMIEESARLGFVSSARLSARGRRHFERELRRRPRGGTG